jgi:hypothetical protein
MNDVDNTKVRTTQLRTTVYSDEGLTDQAQVW